MEAKKDNNGPVGLNSLKGLSGSNMPSGPIVLNIENLSIQFGDSNYHDGPEFLGETELIGGGELLGGSELLDAEDEVVTEMDLELESVEDEDGCSTESHESTVTTETAGHKDVTDHRDTTDHRGTMDHKKSDTGTNGHSTRSSSSGLLYALVRAITAEELLKDAMQEGEDHGDEK